jgi:hypothetical protein
VIVRFTFSKLFSKTRQGPSLISLACPSNCTKCKIPGFGRNSTIEHVMCTDCLSGSALSNGRCVTLSCPKGQFASNSSCQGTLSFVFSLHRQTYNIWGFLACSSSCATCSNFSDNCLTCPDGHFLSGTTCKRTLSVSCCCRNQLIISF